jgi:hypothetical protein
LPDGGFLRQIWKILADLKVVWRAKNISGGLPISGGFDQFCMVLFLSGKSGGFWRFWSLYKQKTILVENYLCKIFSKKIKKNSLATSEIKRNPH